ncbi:unnamed protein product [Schistocephalus solidus]|uniref:BSD domain-containing protein n=1 Tax=Schistocephalus solidus TaxID=70667 RepID=A0A183SND6_SCHSO|nr:unnamed protein product [Schistocephalus solidus]
MILFPPLTGTQLSPVCPSNSAILSGHTPGYRHNRLAKPAEGFRCCVCLHTRLKEDDFWRNYFYRISLIRQAAQLSVLANVSPEDAMYFNSAADEAISEDDNDDDLEAELLMELENMESKSGAGFVISDQKERDREHAKKDASGNDSVISVDDDLERELLAEIEEEEAAAAAAAADRQMP